MINGIKGAFEILDTQKGSVPFEAIEYLREQPKNRFIEEKIIFALSHAYSDIYYDKEQNFWYPTPIWYAVVAEKHLSKSLIYPTIALFTTTNDGWDFLNEQGQYLIGLLAKKYPDEVMEKVMTSINELLDRKSDLPYLFLFEVFQFVDIKKYKDWLLLTLKNKNLLWVEEYANTMAELQIKEALPILKELIKSK